MKVKFHLTITNAIPPLEIKWYENQNITTSAVYSSTASGTIVQTATSTDSWVEITAQKETLSLLDSNRVYTEPLLQMEEFHRVMVMNLLQEMLLLLKVHYLFLTLEQLKIFLQFLLEHVKTILNLLEQ